jgi:Platelet-activating factor acetylhydrolase, isoform II
MPCVYSLCASFLFLVCSQRLATAAASPTLPHPTGEFSIGHTDFDWTDESRPEPLSTIPGAHRELVVSLWYPGEPNARPGADTPYLRGASIIDRSPDSKGLRDNYGNAWPFIVNGKVSTHATESAPLSQIPRGYPLLIFSHGYGVSGFQYTALIENLVSHGFIVAAIEHTFESGPVLLSGNRVVGMSPLSTSHYAPPGPGTSYEQALSNVFAWERERGDVWAADIRFVLDRLTDLDFQQGGPFYKRFNLSRIGAFGHSIGGRFTTRACQLDQRIRVCASLDGSSLRGQYLPYAGAQPPSQPLLFLSEHGTGPPLPPPSDSQLKQMNETLEEFEHTTQRAKAASDRPLQSCQNAC